MRSRRDVDPVDEAVVDAGARRAHVGPSGGRSRRRTSSSWRRRRAGRPARTPPPPAPPRTVPLAAAAAQPAQVHRVGDRPHQPEAAVVHADRVPVHHVLGEEQAPLGRHHRLRREVPGDRRDVAQAARRRGPAVGAGRAAHDGGRGRGSGGRGRRRVGRGRAVLPRRARRRVPDREGDQDEHQRACRSESGCADAAALHGASLIRSVRSIDTSHVSTRRRGRWQSCVRARVTPQPKSRVRRCDPCRAGHAAHPAVRVALRWRRSRPPAAAGREAVRPR